MKRRPANGFMAKIRRCVPMTPDRPSRWRSRSVETYWRKPSCRRGRACPRRVSCPVGGTQPPVGTAGTRQPSSPSRPPVGGTQPPAGTAGARQPSGPSRPPVGGTQPPAGTAGTQRAAGPSRPPIGGTQASTGAKESRRISGAPRPPTIQTASEETTAKDSSAGTHRIKRPAAPPNGNTSKKRNKTC